MEQALEPTADPPWVLTADGYDPLREGSIESRFAISNGFLGIRGARATTRGARWVVPPRPLRGVAMIGDITLFLHDTHEQLMAVPLDFPAADEQSHQVPQRGA